MDSQPHQLQVLFFPFLAPGHMIPLVDMARLFAERGVRVSIVTTPANVVHMHHAVDQSNRSGHSMQLLLLPFPSSEVGLPQGCENNASLTPSHSNLEKFYMAVNLLQQPLERLLMELLPDCIISDTIYWWTSDVAHRVGIPRLVFHATSPFSLCVSDNLEFHGVPNNTEAFVVPGDLPHRIEMTRDELPMTFEYPFIVQKFREAERMSFGAVMNCFYELAPEYVERCKMGGERKVWCLGPVFLSNKTDEDMAERGGRTTLANSDRNQVEWIKSWLDSKESESVLYACFGSGCAFSADQLREIGSGLEASGHPFIWVVRKVPGEGADQDTSDEWLPEGFEERMEGKGLIIRGWAPQVFILNHPAVGGFLTHSGINSTLEATSFGVPMILWPLDSDQFINERFVVDVQKIGLRALEGVRRTSGPEKELVKREVVRKVVARLLDGGEEAKSMRKRVKQYRPMARVAMEEGGSSYVNLSCLIEELTVCAEERKKKKGMGKDLEGFDTI